MADDKSNTPSRSRQEIMRDIGAAIAERPPGMRDELFEAGYGEQVFSRLPGPDVGRRQGGRGLLSGRLAGEPSPEGLSLTLA